MSRSVPEREAAEQALRESEERLRFSLDAGRLGFWQHDLQTDELICSDLCKANFGRAADQPLTHQEVLECVHPDDRERVRAAIRHAVSRGEGYDLEYRVVWPDGSTRWLMVRGRATYDADCQAVGTHGVTLDITARKDAEVRQLEQAERLRLLSESAEHMLTSAEPGTMVRELYNRVQEYLGLDLYLDYAAVPHSSELRLESFAGISSAAAAAIETLTAGQDLPRLLDELWAPASEESGQAHPSAIFCHPLVVGDHYLGTLYFASRSRARFTDDQLDFLRTLSHYVAVAKERVRVEESLREAARRKDEFLAMLAHELRNPLSPVANAIEIMRSQPGSGQAERAREVVDRQIRHMTRLIDDLLDVSRINSGKVTLRMERLDLVAAITQSLETLQGYVAECGHSLDTDLPARPIYVDVDPVRLEQVVTNLINNAAKYTEPGGRIHVSIESDGASAQVRVRDTGIGIPPRLLRQVFDLFTQGERTLDRSQGGLGLGLTLVRNLARLHGGNVEAYSDGPGLGSEFVVTLPVATVDPQPVTQPPPEIDRTPVAATKVRVSRRLLVVDDNRDSAETLAELAELWGFEVDTAYDGLSALQRATEWVPGLLFLDIGMPGLNGYELAARLRQDSRFTNSTFVALTGYGQAEDIERSRAAGFDHHLVKPVDVRKLELMLRSVAPPPLPSSGSPEPA